MKIFDWLYSRRFQLFITTIAFYLLIFSLLRVLFYIGFSGIENTSQPPFAEVLNAFYIGFKFDVRLAILVTLPLLLASVIPKINFFRIPALTTPFLFYFLLINLLLIIFYVIDFGHYDYLGLRVNAGILRFLEDRESATMLWQSYPIVWITLAIISGWLLLSFCNLKIIHHFLNGKKVNINIPSAIFGSLVIFIIGIMGLIGRYQDINLYNPVPLRWNAIHFTQNPALAATALNPVIFFVQTFQYQDEKYDLEKVKKYYPVIANYLSVTKTNTGQPTYERQIPPQEHKLTFTKTPNVVFIMLESLGASRVSAYGLPFVTTPTLDHVADNSLFFLNFYVPVSGTSKTVWASVTGLPDTTTHDTATRNPNFSHQKLVLNEFKEHKKFYFIGGNASWANMSALINQSIDGISLYQEDYWTAPIVDVWGISDLELMRGADRILRQQHLESDEPFLAFIQTAGNHRPFTIPEERGDFEIKELDESLLAKYGFRSREQYNAVRFIDYSLGEFFRLAKESGYFDNTIFIMYGDHNNRITKTPHMSAHFEALDLDGLHVPHMIYAPKLIKPETISSATSLMDVVPTIAGLLGLSYTNTTFGRDIFTPHPEISGDRFVFTSTSDNENPVIGMISENYMLRKFARRDKAKLHDLHADDPSLDISSDKPTLFNHLKELAQGIYVTSHYQRFNNREH